MQLEMKEQAAAATNVDSANRSRLLWEEAVRDCEACGGAMHEASCLARARRAHRSALSRGPLRAVAHASAQLVAVRSEVSWLEGLLGSEHCVALEARRLLASALQGSGALQSGEHEWRQLIEAQRRALGRDSWHCVASLRGLAACLQGQGRAAEAAEAHAAAVASVLASAGPYSAQACAALVQQASLQRLGQDPAGELVSLSAAAEAHARCYGAANWRTKQVCWELVGLLERAGREEEATALKAKHKLKSGTEV
jgi:hypothetical protein